MSANRIIHPRIQLATLKAAVWLLSVSLGIAAQAAPLGPRESERDNRPSITGKLEKLHGDLALDAIQESQWQSAVQTTEALRAQMMDARHQAGEEMKQSLEAPAPDLRALASRMDSRREQQADRRKQAREAWLKFYDGLKPEQKEKASRFLLHQIAMLGEFAPGMMHPRHGEESCPEGPQRGPGERHRS